MISTLPEKPQSEKSSKLVSASPLNSSTTRLSNDTRPTAPASLLNSESQDDDTVRLNGGFTAWSQVFVSFLLVVNGFGYFSSFGLFQSHWATSLKASPSAIAWVGSIMLFLLFFLGILSGPLMDRGHFRSIIIVGCSFQVLGAFSTSAVKTYWQLILAQGLVQGIGNGMLFTPCVTLVSIYFTENRAFALSLAACGAPIGGIVFPLISRQLSGIIGFPWTIRVMGFIMVFNTCLILALGRPRKFKRETRPLLELAAFKERVYLFYAVGIFFTLWGLYIAYFYTSTFGRKIIDLSESDSLTLLLVLNVAGVPGRLVPAFLADRFFGPFNTMLPFVLGSSIMLLVWMRINSSGGFYAFVVIYGVFANAVQTLFPSTLSSLVTDPSKMGQRVGMVFGVGSLACLTGPPLAGVLIDVDNGSYTYMQLYGGVSVMIGFVFLGVSRLCQIRGW